MIQAFGRRMSIFIVEKAQRFSLYLSYINIFFILSIIFLFYIFSLL